MSHCVGGGVVHVDRAYIFYGFVPKDLWQTCSVCIYFQVKIHTAMFILGHLACSEGGNTGSTLKHLGGKELHFTDLQ